MSTLAAPAPSPGPAALVGNDRLLAGLVLGVMSFWLFAQTMLNVAPVVGADLGVGAGAMNTAVALTSLFAGIFVVVMGGLADRVGRVRITRIGFGLGLLDARGFKQAWIQGFLAGKIIRARKRRVVALQGIGPGAVKRGARGEGGRLQRGVHGSLQRPFPSLPRQRRPASRGGP